jgi:hypothetical protein
VSAALWVAIATAVIAAVSALVALQAHRRTVTKDDKQDREHDLEKTITLQLRPLTEKITEFGLTIAGINTAILHQGEQIDKSSTILDAVKDRTAVLETKVELWWKSVAMDAAKILHQPDPARAAVDKVLEAFMAGTLTKAQENELRGYLRIIRDYEPGQQTPFPIHNGEQTAAAILLSTMEHAL